MLYSTAFLVLYKHKPKNLYAIFHCRLFSAIIGYGEYGLDIVIKSEFMQNALYQAQLAAAEDEVPVGAVVVCDGKIIASAHNKTNAMRDALYHAEIIALQQAAKEIGDWRLNRCVLYVTMEPCVMCAGACINYHLGAIVFGAYDKRMGALCSSSTITGGMLCGKNVPFVGGIMEEECVALLTQYFKNKRNAVTSHE